MKDKIKQHNPIERKIKADIIEKNTQRKILEKDINMVKKWNELISKTSSIRKKKKYLNGIKRYAEYIQNGKTIVTNMIKDLEKRIKDEMKYSEKEIKDLQDSYKKEYDELVTAEEKVMKAKSGTLSDEEKKSLIGIIFDENGKEKKLPKEYVIAKAMKKFKKEMKDVKDVHKEITSEEKDKALFENELKRMSVEKELLV